jgi:hypothetical protein
MKRVPRGDQVLIVERLSGQSSYIADLRSHIDCHM